MKNKSFTLIELLVVIVIIGILAGVIMISTSSSIDKANFAKAQAFSSTVQNELLSNLVSEWTFDEGSNQAINRVATDEDVKDTWGNNHGKVFGDPQVKGENACAFKKCLEFDGVGDYVNLGNSEDLSINYGKTFSFWIKNSDYLNEHGFIYSPKSGLCSIRFDDNTNYINFGPSSNRMGLSTTNLINNNWYYMVAVYGNNNSIKVYLNGVDLTVNTGDYWGTSTVFNSIGSRSGSNCLNGFIDDFRIYNASLSSSQIKQNYIAGLNSMLANGNISKQEYNERLESLSSN